MTLSWSCARNCDPAHPQNQSGRRSAIDGRTTRHAGYALSQRIRKRIEEAFGWAKTVAGLRKMRHRGLPKVDWQFTLAMAAYDLVRLPNCLPNRRVKLGSQAQIAPRTAHPLHCPSKARPVKPLLTIWQLNGTPYGAQVRCFSASC